MVLLYWSYKLETYLLMFEITNLPIAHEKNNSQWTHLIFLKMVMTHDISLDPNI